MGFNCQPRIFSLDIRKSCPRVKTLQLWNRLQREVVGSPSVDVLKEMPIKFCKEGQKGMSSATLYALGSFHNAAKNGFKKTTFADMNAGQHPPQLTLKEKKKHKKAQPPLQIG